MTGNLFATIWSSIVDKAGIVAALACLVAGWQSYQIVVLRRDCQKERDAMRDDAKQAAERDIATAAALASMKTALETITTVILSGTGRGR